MIRSFRDSKVEALFRGQRVRRFLAVEKVARRKLEMLHAATSLADLGAVPGNRIEALKMDRRGQHSIRINDQFRICFVWADGEAHNVEIVDYH